MQSAPTKDSPDAQAPHTAASARNIRAIAALQMADKTSSSLSERMAESIAAFCGSVTFVWLHLLWFMVWIFFNSVPWMRPHIDPFPFTFLTLVVSLEAIFLSAFILISQNRETKIADRRNHLDLQINLLTEQESTKTLLLLNRICAKLGIEVDDPEIPDLVAITHPENVVDMIKSEIEEGEFASSRQ